MAKYSVPVVMTYYGLVEIEAENAEAENQSEN